MRMAHVEELDESEIRQVMLSMPFEKFERRRFMEYDPRDLALIRFVPILWRQLNSQDLTELLEICRQSIARYYERVE